MKKRFSLVLTLVIALSMVTLAACSGDSGSAPSSSNSPAVADPVASSDSEVVPSPAAAAPVEIRAAWWGDTNRFELYNKIVAEFNEVYPEVTVVVEPASWNDYWDKLTVQSAGGNAPDFMGMHPQYAADYIGRGVIEPLDQMIADGVIDLSGFPEGVINTGVVGGKDYMVPMGVTFQSYVVNTGLFEELGITKPSFDWTWDDVKSIGLEAREKLNAAGRQSAFLRIDDSANINNFRYFVRQQGRELYDENGDINFTAADAEAWWTMQKEFRDLGIIPDAATTTEYATATLENSLFAQDKVLVYGVPVNQYKLYCTTFPDKTISLVRAPSTAGKAVGEFPEGAHFAISANSTPDAKIGAAKLLNFWVNSEESLKLFGLDQGVPGNMTMADAYTPSLDEYQLEIQSYVDKLSKIGTATIFPPTGASEVDAAFKSLGEAVSFDAKTPAAAAEELIEQAKAIIAKNRG